MGVALLCWSSASAAPFRPADDDEVLQRLAVVSGTGLGELAALRAEHLADPENLSIATHLAWRYVKLAQAQWDPRYGGYAQAVLAPWWDRVDPPVEVLVLRATLRQHGHDFDGALADLARVLAKNPRHGQAWLTRALIHQVRGNYASALKSCMRLLSLADTLTAATCICSVRSFTGNARESRQFLERTLAESSGAPRPVRLWALTVLAEIAARLGDAEDSEQRFAEAMSLGVDDAYLLGAYADLLLEQGNYQGVRTLLRNQTRVDGLLLRLALAEKALAGPRQAQYTRTLQARFRESRLRGRGQSHLREEARFTLELLDKPAQALKLAQQNWTAQREPADARVLLQAALAAHRPKAAVPVLECLRASGLEDRGVQSQALELERKLGNA